MDVQELKEDSSGRGMKTASASMRMQRPEVFGAIYDLTDYRSTFGTATADFLAGNIVSNDLAGPPGHGVMLDVDWADGLCLIRI